MSALASPGGAHTQYYVLIGMRILTQYMHARYERYERYERHERHERHESTPAYTRIRMHGSTGPLVTLTD